MTVPLDRNIALKEIEKKSKYKDQDWTRNTENAAYENRSNPCWCAWYSKEGDGRKHQRELRDAYSRRCIFLDFGGKIKGIQDRVLSDNICFNFSRNLKNWWTIKFTSDSVQFLCFRIVLQIK